MSRHSRPVAAGVACLLSAALAAMLAGCGPTRGAPPGPDPVELRVAAAASLRTAVERATAAYTAANPWVTFTITSDSSATLRTQIEQGAPVDVFLSADEKNPEALAAAGAAAGVPVPFAGNRVALVVPADNPARITTPADLVRPGVKVVAAGEQVPISGYVARVLANLQASAGYGSAFADEVEANVVSREDNVAAVLAKVELGEADAGFVYATDAAGSGRVRTIPIDDAANVTAVDAGIVVGSSAHPAEAAAFLAWLRGADGQAVLAALGFLPPP